MPLLSLNAQHYFMLFLHWLGDLSDCWQSIFYRQSYSTRKMIWWRCYIALSRPLNFECIMFYYIESVPQADPENCSHDNHLKAFTFIVTPILKSYNSALFQSYIFIVSFTALSWLAPHYLSVIPSTRPYIWQPLLSSNRA